MMDDPDFCDEKIAGWWVWGACQWIGSGWCALEYTRQAGIKRDGTVERKRPELYSQKGVHRLRLQRPHLTSRGLGVHSGNVSQQIPHLSAAGNTGVLAKRTRSNLAAYFQALADRMRYVRVTCGDWSRVVGKSVTWNNNCTRGKHAYTAVVLDPPYDPKVRQEGLYSHDDHDREAPLSTAVRQWALAEGENPKMRIVLCGYADEHATHMPASWECVAWAANGGYANQNQTLDGNSNKHNERLWFSPHCLRPETKESLTGLPLFQGAG
jgi:hypothetical protein